MLISEILDPRVFTNTGSNPNSKTVTLMFSNLGIQKVFDIIKKGFEQQWNKPITHNSIEKTLDEIIQRRHAVAHTAVALDISRAELKESIRFLKIVAKLLDAELKKCVDNILEAV
jgi:RiboL-PSP-HEPN